MKVYFSRHGLVQCPACKHHFRAPGSPGDPGWLTGVACPVCDTLLGTNSGGSTLDRLRNTGRSGMIAAALFGMTATAPLVGCEKTDTNEPGEEQPASPDATPEPASPDVSVAEYGAPPPQSEPDAESAPADETNIQPEYGAPAMPVEQNSDDSLAEPDAQDGKPTSDEATTDEENNGEDADVNGEEPGEDEEKEDEEEKDNEEKEDEDEESGQLGSPDEDGPEPTPVRDPPQVTKYGLAPDHDEMFPEL